MKVGGTGLKTYVLQSHRSPDVDHRFHNKSHVVPYCPCSWLFLGVTDGSTKINKYMGPTFQRVIARLSYNEILYTYKFDIAMLHFYSSLFTRSWCRRRTRCCRPTCPVPQPPPVRWWACRHGGSWVCCFDPIVIISLHCILRVFVLECSLGLERNNY